MIDDKQALVKTTIADIKPAQATVFKGSQGIPAPHSRPLTRPCWTGVGRIPTKALLAFVRTTEAVSAPSSRVTPATINAECIADPRCQSLAGQTIGQPVALSRQPFSRQAADFDSVNKILKFA
jgi:hypothetical protein